MVAAVKFDVRAQPMVSVPCALCGTGPVAIVATKERSGLPLRTVQCVRCGLRYLNPRMTAEAYAEFYQYGYRDSLMRLGMFNVSPNALKADQRAYGTHLLGQIEAFLPTQGRLLDIGGSTGIVARMVAGRTGLKPTVLDPAAAELKHAHGCEQVLGAVETATFPPQSFAVILFCRAIEHCLQPVEALRQCRRWIAPGGVLAIDAMNVDRWSPQSRYKVDHPYAFTAATLRKVLETTGWRVQHTWLRREGRYMGFLCTTQEG